ncbi:MAG: VCBS repeat-containing protein, partial [Pseudomonadota bacterium]
MRRSSPLVIAIGALSLAGCNGGTPTPSPAAPEAAPATQGPPPLRDVTAAVGIDFRYHNGRSDARYMPEIMGAGAALFDADNDGDLDLYLIQGGPLDDTDVPRQDRFLRNDLSETGTLGFTDVTDAAGIPATAYGMGVATGDVDGDGNIDLYLTNLGANVLLRNRGDGTFEDITQAAGAEDALWSVPTTFLDIDGDGDHDLFV